MTDLLFDRSIVKGGEISRAVPVNSQTARRAISEILSAGTEEKYGTRLTSIPTVISFSQRTGRKNGSVAMNRQTAHEMLKKDAFKTAGTERQTRDTQSLRKSPLHSASMRKAVTIYLLCRSCSVTEIRRPRRRSTIGVNYATARPRRASEAIVIRGGTASNRSSARSTPSTMIADRATLFSELELLQIPTFCQTFIIVFTNLGAGIIKLG